MLKYTIGGMVIVLIIFILAIFLPKKTIPTNSTIKVSASKQYLDYSKSEFDLANSKRRLLFFYAAWCPTCRPADADLKDNVNNFPKDLVVFRVNYDTETELKQKYGITYQHTYVQVDKNESEIVKWNGGQTKELLERIK